MANGLNEQVAKSSGSQPDRLAALGMSPDAVADLVQQALDLDKQRTGIMQQRQDVSQQRQENAGQSPLTTLPGILSLLGAGAAGIAGRGDVATGILSGGLQGVQDAQGRKEQGLGLQEQGLAGQQDFLMETLDKQRTRITTLLQTHPDMFVDIDGNPLIDPRLIGYLATGAMIPIDPSMNYALKRQTAVQKSQAETGVTMMLNGETPDVVEQGLTMYNHALGLDMQPGLLEALKGATGGSKEQWDLIWRHGDFDPVSVLAAQHASNTMGLPPSHPEIATMFQPNISDEVADTFPKKILQSNAILQARAIERGVDILEMGYVSAVDFLMSEDLPVDATELKKWYGGDEGTGVSNADKTRLLMNAMPNFRQLFLLNPDAPMFTDKGIRTDDDLTAWIAETGLRPALARMRQFNAEEASRKVGANFLRIEQELIRRAQAEAPELIGAGEVPMQIIEDQYKELLEASMDGESLDLQKFEANLKAWEDAR